MRHEVRRAALAGIAAAALLAGCQAPASPGASGGVEPVASTSGPGDSAATLGPAESPTPDPNRPTAIDPALLAYLPERVGGATVEEDVNEAALAASRPTLSRLATAVDVGVALDESRTNLVTAHVVRLRAGAFGDAAYRDWRDTFDEGACAAADGVQGRSEATIDDRTVYITTCVKPLRIYHLWIEDEALLISAWSIGEDRFGEQLMNELRIP